MKSLRSFILAMIALLTIICAAAFFMVSNKYSTETLNSTIEDDMQELSQAVSLAIKNMNDSSLYVMKSFASLPFMKNKNMGIREKQLQLDQVMAAIPHFTGLNLTDDKGVSFTHEMGMFDFSFTPGVSAALQGKTGVADPEKNAVTGGLAMMYYCPMYDDNHQIIGTFFTSVNGESLSDVCKTFKVAKTGYPMIINRNTGLTVAHSDVQYVYDENNLNDMKKVAGYEGLGQLYDDIVSKTSGFGYYDVGGDKKIAAFCPIEDTDWEVIVIAPYSEFSFRLKNMNIIMGIVSILVIVLGVVVSLLVGKALKPLKTVGSAIDEIASGNADLTKRLEIKNTPSEISSVIKGFNKFVEKLHEIMSQVKDAESHLATVGENLNGAMNDTTAAISGIISNVGNVNSQIEHQSASVQQTAGAVNEIASNIESLEHMIDTQSNGVSTASSAVEEMVGNIISVNGAVEKMVKSFNELQENATSGISTQASVNERIQHIEEQSKMLQDANTAISDIAEQTNLLAMNAAIEAAHAGEAGKGFSVVADEIRKLSETSSSQSKTIGDELTKIQDSINEVVAESSKSTMAFNIVQASLSQTEQIIEQIRGAMEEQQIGSKQITDALKSMNDSTFQVKTASEEMAAGNKQILDEIQNLQSATTNMKSSVEGISTSTNQISQIGEDLNSFSGEMANSITQIGSRINEFKV